MERKQSNTIFEEFNKNVIEVNESINILQNKINKKTNIDKFQNCERNEESIKMMIDNLKETLQYNNDLIDNGNKTKEDLKELILLIDRIKSNVLLEKKDIISRNNELVNNLIQIHEEKRDNEMKPLKDKIKKIEEEFEINKNDCEKMRLFDESVKEKEVKENPFILNLSIQPQLKSPSEVFKFENPFKEETTEKKTHIPFNFQLEEVINALKKDHKEEGEEEGEEEFEHKNKNEIIVEDEIESEEFISSVESYESEEFISSGESYESEEDNYFEPVVRLKEVEKIRPFEERENKDFFVENQPPQQPIIQWPQQNVQPQFEQMEVEEEMEWAW